MMNNTISSIVENSAARILLSERCLVTDILMATPNQGLRICTLLDQVKLARAQHNTQWLKVVAQDCIDLGLGSSDWVTKYVYSAHSSKDLRYIPATSQDVVPLSKPAPNSAPISPQPIPSLKVEPMNSPGTHIRPSKDPKECPSSSTMTTAVLHVSENKPCSDETLPLTGIGKVGRRKRVRICGAEKKRRRRARAFECGMEPEKQMVPSRDQRCKRNTHLEVPESGTVSEDNLCSAETLPLTDIGKNGCRKRRRKHRSGSLKRQRKKARAMEFEMESENKMGPSGTKKRKRKKKRKVPESEIVQRSSVDSAVTLGALHFAKQAQIVATHRMMPALMDQNPQSSLALSFQFAFRAVTDTIESNKHNFSLVRGPGMERLESRIPSDDEQGQCLFEDCNYTGPSLKTHTVSCHLPDLADLSGPLGSDAARARAVMLSAIKSYILGTMADLQDLVNYVRIRYVERGSRRQQLTSAEQIAMYEVCPFLDIVQPSALKLEPLECPVVLLHWELMAFMMTSLSLQKRNLIMKLFMGTRICDAVCSSDVEQIRSHDGPRAIATEPPSAYDAHFHIDRTCHLLGLKNATLSDLCQRIYPADSAEIIRLEGAVAAFCDPQTYPSIDQLRRYTEAGLKVCVGIHPLSVASSTFEDWLQLSDLAQDHCVTGLGEIGLDGFPPTRAQMLGVDKALAWLKPHHVLVLSCRPSANLPTLLQLVLRAKTTTRNTVIHLHCFRGSIQDIKSWLKHLPLTHFGFTTLATVYKGEDLEGLSQVPVTRFLLESDAPYVDIAQTTGNQAMGNMVSSPATLGMTATAVSRVMGVSREDLLCWSAANAVRVTTDPLQQLAQPGPCNIDVVDVKKAPFSQNDFLDRYAYSKPVVIRGATDNTKFRFLCEKSSMLQNYGNKIIRLSSANTHSYKKRDVTLKHYVEEFLIPQTLNKLGNETFYWFGDNNYTEWQKLFDEYTAPPYQLPNMYGIYSFGLAAAGTGVPFHFHGPGFGEVVHGRKRWFLYPPEKQPSFDPDKSTLHWLLQEYNNLHPADLPLECTLEPGDVIYFPDRWWHGTLNIDTSVFISTFLG